MVRKQAEDSGVPSFPGRGVAVKSGSRWCVANSGIMNTVLELLTTLYLAFLAAPADLRCVERIARYRRACGRGCRVLLEPDRAILTCEPSMDGVG